MRYTKRHSEQTKAKFRAGASRAFRKHGHAGVGVDGLAKEAGVSSGAFYTHFESKDDAFRAAVSDGMGELLTGIRAFKEQHKANWLTPFINWYLSEDHRKDLASTCALVTLSPEVMRADKASRIAFTSALDLIVIEIADGLVGGSVANRKDRARAILSILSGSVTLARSMSDPAIAASSASAANAAITQLAAL